MDGATEYVPVLQSETQGRKSGREVCLNIYEVEAPFQLLPD